VPALFPRRIPISFSICDRTEIRRGATTLLGREEIESVEEKEEEKKGIEVRTGSAARARGVCMQMELLLCFAPFPRSRTLIIPAILTYSVE